MELSCTIKLTKLITLNRMVTLPQLAALLNTIHEISSHYDAVKYNCYWYTYILVEVIWREFSSLVSNDKNVKRKWYCNGFDLRKGVRGLPCTRIEKRIAEKRRSRCDLHQHSRSQWLTVTIRHIRYADYRVSDDNMENNNQFLYALHLSFHSLSSAMGRLM